MVIKFNHAAIKFTHLIKLWVKNSVATLLILTFSPSVLQVLPLPPVC